MVFEDFVNNNPDLDPASLQASLEPFGAEIVNLSESNETRLSGSLTRSYVRAIEIILKEIVENCPQTKAHLESLTLETLSPSSDTSLDGVLQQLALLGLLSRLRTKRD